MSIAVPIILFILMVGLSVAMDILGWKNFRHLYWLISVITGFVGNVTFFLMMGYYNSLAVAQRESVQIAADLVPYGRYSIICAMFAFFLLGLIVFAIVFWIGRYLINKEERPYFRG